MLDEVEVDLAEPEEQLRQPDRSPRQPEPVGAGVRRQEGGRPGGDDGAVEQRLGHIAHLAESVAQHASRQPPSGDTEQEPRGAGGSFVHHLYLSHRTSQPGP